MTCEFGQYVYLTANEARLLAEAAVHAEHGYRTPEVVALLETMCNQMVWDDLQEEPCEMKRTVYIHGDPSAVYPIAAEVETGGKYPIPEKQIDHIGHHLTPEFAAFVVNERIRGAFGHDKIQITTLKCDV